jgi:molybdenum cofactor biosynthesis enzyme MoaA
MKNREEIAASIHSEFLVLTCDGEEILHPELKLAEYYLVGDTGVTVVLITMPSQNFKCGLSRCHKMRVSPFGLVGSCIQQQGVNVMGLSLIEKIRVVKEAMFLRESYSDELPTSRQHFRDNYGIWRFGLLKGGEK